MTPIPPSLKKQQTRQSDSTVTKKQICHRFQELLDQYSQEDTENPLDLKQKIQRQIRQDLEDMYLQAKGEGSMSVALKAKELQGKDFGMFGLEKIDPTKGIPLKPLSKMTPAELYHIISATCEDLGLQEEDYAIE